MFALGSCHREMRVIIEAPTVAPCAAFAHFLDSKMAVASTHPGFEPRLGSFLHTLAICRNTPFGASSSLPSNSAGSVTCLWRQAYFLDCAEMQLCTKSSRKAKGCIPVAGQFKNGKLNHCCGEAPLLEGLCREMLRAAPGNIGTAEQEQQPPPPPPTKVSSVTHLH